VKALGDRRAEKCVPLVNLPNRVADTFSGGVFDQIANVFICRSERQSVFARGIFSNRLILIGVAAEILLIALIVYTPWGHSIFGTAPISLSVWLFIIPFAFGMIVLEELRKWLVRHRAGEKGVW